MTCSVVLRKLQTARHITNHWTSLRVVTALNPPTVTDSLAEAKLALKTWSAIEPSLTGDVGSVEATVGHRAVTAHDHRHLVATRLEVASASPRDAHAAQTARLRRTAVKHLQQILAQLASRVTSQCFTE